MRTVEPSGVEEVLPLGEEGTRFEEAGHLVVVELGREALDGDYPQGSGDGEDEDEGENLGRSPPGLLAALSSKNRVASPRLPGGDGDQSEDPADGPAGEGGRPVLGVVPKVDGGGDTGNRERRQPDGRSTVPGPAGRSLVFVAHRPP